MFCETTKKAATRSRLIVSPNLTDANLSKINHFKTQD